MAGSIDITLSDLEGRFDPTTVARVFCDDGTGEPGPRFAASCSTARRLADAVLLRAWGREQIELLVHEDAAIRGFIMDLVMADGMSGRLEWSVENGPAERLRKTALDNLKLVADGELRSVGEAVGAGSNPHTRGGKVSTNRSPSTFVFAPSQTKPRRGGF